MPDFPRALGGTSWSGRAPEPRASTTSPTSGCGPGAARVPAPSAAPATRTPSAAMVTAVDRGRWTCAPDGDATRRAGRGDAGPRAGPDARRRRRPGRPGRRPVSGEARHARPHRPGRGAHAPCCAAPPTTPTPSSALVVANAEQLVIVTAVADPTPRTGFVDRCLVAAYAGGLAPLLCLTKADLTDPGPFAAHYAELELPVLITRRDEPERLAALADALAGRGDGARRALGRRQVDAGQRAGAGRRPGGRAGQRRRQGPAHHRGRARAAAAADGAAGWSTHRACGRSGSRT